MANASFEIHVYLVDYMLLMLTLGRFELPTCGLGNRRSIHLSYRATPVVYRLVNEMETR